MAKNCGPRPLNLSAQVKTTLLMFSIIRATRAQQARVASLPAPRLHLHQDDRADFLVHCTALITLSLEDRISTFRRLSDLTAALAAIVQSRVH